MATKSANLYARIEPDVKEQAEGILAAWGIPASNAINMFYKQIILQRGLPFELKSPENASGQLDRLEACILSCSIYSGWWYTSGYDYSCYVRWKRCGYAIKKIYKNKIIWKHQSEMVGAFFMPEEICFLCPFLRKEVSTVANRIMGITVKIGKDTTKLQTGFLYNSKCRKNKKLYFINVS